MTSSLISQPSVASAPSEKLLVYDIRNAEQYFRYHDQVRATCSLNGLEDYCRDTLVDEEKPGRDFIESFGERPDFIAEDALWQKMGLDRYKDAIEKWDQRQLARLPKCAKTTSIYHQHLMDAGKQTIAEVMQLANAKDRLSAVKALIKDKYAPHGPDIVFALRKEYDALTDANGVMEMLAKMTKLENQIRLIDPDALPTDDHRKLILSHGIKTSTFLTYLLQAKTDETFLTISQKFNTWCQNKPQLDENSVKGKVALGIQITAADVGIPPGPGWKRQYYTVGSCYNCGGEGHTSDECTALTCGGCGYSYESVGSPGWHVSKTCPYRLPAVPGGKGGRGSGGGRGGNPGRGGGRAGRGGRGGGNQAAKAAKAAKSAKSAAKSQNKQLAKVLAILTENKAAAEASKATIEAMDTRMKAKNI